MSKRHSDSDEGAFQCLRKRMRDDSSNRIQQDVGIEHLLERARENTSKLKIQCSLIGHTVVPPNSRNF